MATFNPGMRCSFPAAGTLAAWTLVVINSSRQVTNAAVSTARDVIGVVMEPAVAGQVVQVQTLHVASVKVLTDNTAITVGTLLYKGASGKVSATSTGSAAVGYALEANGSTDGTVIEMAPLQM